MGVESSKRAFSARNKALSFVGLLLGSLTFDIQFSAEKRGWQVAAQSGADLSERDAWPAVVLEQPLGHLAALQVEQLLDLELAEEFSGAVVIPWDRFAAALELELPLITMWSEPSPLMLAVSRVSDLGRKDFAYKYAFRLGARDVAVQRVGYFVRHTSSGRTFHLDVQAFGLVDAMDRFNSLPQEDKTKRESWLSFATIKGCSRAVGASLDATLEANDVVVPSEIGLSIWEHDDGSLSFVPTCPELSPKEFREAFLRSRKGDDLFQIDAGEGRRVRVALGERHSQVLDRMRGVRRLKGTRKEEAARHPERFFEGLLDSVEIRFWDRVTGIGELPFPTVPHDARADAGFFDRGSHPTSPSKRTVSATSITLPGPAGEGEIRLSFPDDRSRAHARRMVASALDNGEIAIELQGKTITPSQELLDALAEDPTETHESERGTNSGRKFLLIHSNESEHWSPAFSVPKQNVSPDLAHFELPKKLKRDIPLKKHQVHALKWLRRCDMLRPSRRGVLLADDMGLGKTLQILTHLAWLIEQGRLRGSPEADPSTAPYRPILIVAPLILVENETWLGEMVRFFEDDGALFRPVLQLHSSGIAKVRRDVDSKGIAPETVVGLPSLDPDKLMKYRTVITNYETVVNYQHSLAQLKKGRPIWSAIITDEAQKYKSPATKISVALKAIDSDFCIASTGTPVENRLLDLWNILDTLQPGYLGTAKDFAATYEHKVDGDSREQILASLRQRLQIGEAHTFLLRRTKDELLGGDLPEKRIVRLEADMSTAEIEAHQSLVGVLGSERRKGRHLSILQRLQQLYQHPVLLEGSDQLADSEYLLRESSKLRAVLSQLCAIKELGEKVIIFARLIDVQQILAQVIHAQLGCEVPIINGAANKAKGYTSSTAGSGRAKDARKRVLDQFKAQPGFGVIILSPFVAGIGLTITEANHVIHYGRWWNPAVEAQATDRVYRLGQTKPVTVYLPILRDTTGQLLRTFDQALDDLLTRKAAMARDFLHPSEAEDDNAKELCNTLLGDKEDLAIQAPLTAEELDKLSPADFEAAVAALYAAEGYSVVLTSLGNDGGADVIAIKNGVVELVQAKHSGAGNQVDVQAVSDLLGAIDIYRVQLEVNVRLRVVSNTSLTRQAKDLAYSHGVQVLGGHELFSRLEAAGVGIGTTAAMAASRCRSFHDGVQQAREILNGLTP